MCSPALVSGSTPNPAASGARNMVDPSPPPHNAQPVRKYQLHAAKLCSSRGNLPLLLEPCGTACALTCRTWEVCHAATFSAAASHNRNKNNLACGGSCFVPNCGILRRIVVCDLDGMILSFLARSSNDTAAEALVAFVRNQQQRRAAKEPRCTSRTTCRAFRNT